VSEVPSVTTHDRRDVLTAPGNREASVDIRDLIAAAAAIRSRRGGHLVLESRAVFIPQTCSSASREAASS